MSILAKSRRSRGVTLVELLITMTIASMLASLVLFAMAAVQDKSRYARTQAIIQRLDNVIQRQYEGYQTRRITADVPTGLTRQAAAAIRLNAIRRLMMSEMPDRYRDIVTSAGAQYLPLGNQFFTEAHFSYYTSYVNNRTPTNVNARPTIENQSAECLYYVVSMSGGGIDSKQLFADLSQGDTDKDGAPEFVDGWNRPIHWLRWPVGFLNTPTLLVSERQTGDATNDHDPFDPLMVHTVAFRTYPLIFSAGNDGLEGIVTNNSGTTIATAFDYIVPVPPNIAGQSVVNPYRTVSGSSTMGSPIGVDWRDNIHNHMQGYR